MKAAKLLIVFLAIGFLLACQSPVNKESTGQLKVTAGVSLAKSILPGNATITSYTATGSGPSGASITTTNSATGSFTFMDLVTGSWTIHVDGLDSLNSVVASGSTTISIGTGTTATANIDLVPLSGTGTLALAASWSNGNTIDEVSGTLTPDGGSPTAISLAVSGNSASYADAALNSGSYVVVLNFKKGGLYIASTKTEAVVIYKGKTSTGAFNLTASDFNPLKTITYNANGGTGTSTDPHSPYYLGCIATTLANAFIRTGFTFSGWNTMADGTGKQYATEVGIVITADMTLYAQWRDSAPPSVIIANPANNLVQSSGSVTFSGTAIDASSGIGQVVVQMDLMAPQYASWDNATNTWSNTWTGLANGTYVFSVYATDNLGNKSNPISVTVTIANVTNITFDKSTLSLVSGGASASLIATIAPANAPDHNITWSTDDSSVATVDASGVVTPHSLGTTNIYATVVSNNINYYSARAICKVYVCPSAPANIIATGGISQINLNFTSDGSSSYTVYYKAGLTVTPSDADALQYTAVNGWTGNITIGKLMKNTQYAFVLVATNLRVVGSSPPSSVVLGTTSIYAFGDTGPAGGYIFYDKGSNLGGWQYLEAAPVNQNNAVQWYNGTYKTIVTTGTGKANTDAIIVAQGSGVYAASLCRTYSLNGFTDWFLPNDSELALMKSGLFSNNIGGLSGDYWSSTQHPSLNFSASWLNFDNYNGGGFAGTDNKYAVRAIREF